MSRRLQTAGNKDTMNLHNVLYLNVVASPYLRGLADKQTFNEIVDEIYYSGTNASTSSCLLFKLHTLRLTERQMDSLLNHVDSPFIRALGFMYLRYAGVPAQLWDWFEGYLDDDEEVVVKGGVHPKTMTMGMFCRTLLTELKWFDTMLPRIPVPIARDIEQKIRDHDAKKARRGGHHGSGHHTTQDTYTDAAAHRSRDKDSKSPRSPGRGSRSGGARSGRSVSPYSRDGDRSRDRDRDGGRDRDRDRGRDRDRSRDRGYDRSYRR